MGKIKKNRRTFAAEISGRRKWDQRAFGRHQEGWVAPNFISDSFFGYLENELFL